MLASHLRHVHGFDAVHVNEAGLSGASDPAVLAFAIAEERIVMTSNADDFRGLARKAGTHPGMGVFLGATGRARQIVLGTALAQAIEEANIATDQLFEIDRDGRIRQYKLP